MYLKRTLLKQIRKKIFKLVLIKECISENNFTLWPAGTEEKRKKFVSAWNTEKCRINIKIMKLKIEYLNFINIILAEKNLASTTR